MYAEGNEDETGSIFLSLWLMTWLEGVAGGLCCQDAGGVGVAGMDLEQVIMESPLSRCLSWF